MSYGQPEPERQAVERAIAQFGERYGRLPDLEDGMDACRIVVLVRGAGGEAEARALYERAREGVVVYRDHTGRERAVELIPRHSGQGRDRVRSE